MGGVVRLAFGAVSLIPSVSLAPELGALLRRESLPTHPSWWLAVALGLCVFPYVINIGFTVNWGRWPRVVAAVVLAASVLASLAVTGATWSPVAGAAFYVWIVYTFGHLGLSFLLASAIATPGCEMRAFPHLWGILSGRAAKEHYCPGVLDPIDRWEERRRTEGSTA